MFLYTSPAHSSHHFKFNDEWLTKEPYQDIIKLYKIISLFREEGTYKIVFVDAEYTQEHKQQLTNYNIDYIQGDPVEVEKFWIYPCIEKIKTILK
jgi:hypothetical protein